MATRIEEVVYEAPPLWARVLESAVITALVPLIGLLLHPADPLFYASAFSWLVIAPLLVGLRYGFIYGFVSAVFTVAVMTVLPQFGYEHGPIPAAYAIGVVLTGMIAGEFTDIWRRRFTQMKIINDYQTTRLEEFVRNYHLLRVSHDQLAERLAANPHNLRDALLELADQFHDVDAGNDILRRRAAEILSFLAAEGRLQQCAIYAVDEHQRVEPQPMDFLGGTPPDLDVARNAMVRAALDNRCMISLKSEMADEMQSASQNLLAVIPLIDVDQRIWALVTVTEMPFVVFERGNLHLLSVLGGNLGDIVSEAYDRRPADAQRAAFQFERRLRRWTAYARRYKLTSLLMAYEIPGPIRGISNAALADLVFEQLRALDFGWLTDAGGGTQIIYVLMPLTPERGAGAYRARMTKLLHERYGVVVADTGLEFHQRVVDGRTAAETMLADIRRVAESHASA